MLDFTINPQEYRGNISISVISGYGLRNLAVSPSAWDFGSPAETLGRCERRKNPSQAFEQRLRGRSEKLFKRDPVVANQNEGGFQFSVV